MSKSIVTLPPSKATVVESASQIYAAYVSAGQVADGDSERWLKRAIREAIAIARTVDSAIRSDNELPADRPVVVEPEQSGPTVEGDINDAIDDILSGKESDTSTPLKKSAKGGRQPERSQTPNDSDKDAPQNAAEAAAKKVAAYR